MAIPTTQCSVFIQIWVDTNAVQQNSSRGVYLVDNRVSSGSQNEGTASLATACTNNSFVCWQVFTVDPNAQASVSIQSISNSNAWGNSGQPQMASDIPSAFTGQVQNPGNASYSLTLLVNLGTGSGFQLPINNLGMNVLAQATLVAA